MNNASKFLFYKKVKNKICMKYKGYALEKILALDLIVLVYSKRNLNYKDFTFFFRSISLSKISKSNKNATMFSMGQYGGRKDYYEIWDFVKNCVSNLSELDFTYAPKKIRFRLSNLITAFKCISLARKDLSIQGVIILASKLTYYLNIIDEVEKLNPLAKKYCAFSSVLPLEAILTSYFKLQGTPTYSLQHGLYFVFKENVLIDSLAYENLISDYHFCWGKYTKDEFQKYGINTGSLIIGGYPRAVNRKKRPVMLNKNNCVVLFSRQAFHDTNLHLIELLRGFSEKFKVKFYFKLHPTLTWDYYKKIADDMGWEIIPKEKTINELFNHNEFGWAIAINTAAYYEAYLNYIPCLRFNDGSFEDSIDISKDCFNNNVGLNYAFQNIPFDDENDLNTFFDRTDDKLKYTMGLNQNNYQILNEKNS